MMTVAAFLAFAIVLVWWLSRPCQCKWCKHKRGSL